MEDLTECTTEELKNRVYERAAQRVIDAGINMVNVKGRHHSELAMNQLIDAVKEYRAVKKCRVAK